MPTVSITVNFQGTAEGFSITGFGMFYLTPSDNTGTIVYTEGQTYTAEINTGGKLYNVVGTGCTISNIQNTAFNVVFTSDTATIRVYADNPSSIIGAYTLNQTLNRLGDVGQQYDISVSFTSDDEARGGFSFVNNPAEWYIRYTGGPQPPVAYNGNTGWMDQSYRLVDFGDTAQEVPAMFKSWIEANGTTPLYNVSSATTNTTVSVSGGNSHAQGDPVQFTVTANSGYTLSSVIVVRASGGSSVPTLSLGDGRYMFYMPGENVTIQAASILSSTNCTVVFDDGVLNVSIETTGVEGTWKVSGTTVNVSITTSGVYLFDVFLRSGYTLSNVTGAGCTISNINRTNGTFNVVFTEAESTISVTTERRVYSIAREPVNASITAQGTAPAGANVSFTVTANTGYGTDSVLVRQSSGAVVAVTSLGNGRYYFTMPDSDVVITATATLASTNCTVTFDKGVMSVTTTAGSGGGTWHFSGTTGYISGISTSGRYTSTYRSPTDTRYPT